MSASGREAVSTTDLSTSGANVAAGESDSEISIAEEFLLDHGELLASSSRIWRGVSQAFEPFTDGRVEDDLRDFFHRQPKSSRRSTAAEKHHLLQRSLPRLRTLTDDLATYLLVASTVTSSTGRFPSHSRDLLPIVETEDEHINDILEFLLKDTDYSTNFFPLPRMISEARGIRAQTVNDLVLSARQSSGVFSELQALGNDPQYGAAVAELRRVSAADWHAPEPEMSMLRRHVASLKDDNGALLDEFVDEIAQTPLDSANGHERQARVHNMIGFALAAQGIESPTQPQIWEVLMATRSRWGEYADIEGAYQEFKRIRINELTRDMDSFVGDPHAARTNVRYPRSHQELETLRGSFRGYFDGTRVAKRAKEMRRRLIMPSSQQIASEALPSKEEQRTWQPALLKAVGKNFVLGEFDLEDLLKPLNGDRPMREEMARAIEVILTDPFGAATKNLHALRKITIDGQLFRGRRFAPDHHPDLSTSSINRWRIVYGVSNEQIAFLGPMHHEEFDRRFS